MMSKIIAENREMTLSEALSDQLIRQMMRADGVDPCDLAAMLGEVARELRARRDNVA
jgi:hypothetical protein